MSMTTKPFAFTARIRDSVAHLALRGIAQAWVWVGDRVLGYDLSLDEDDEEQEDDEDDDRVILHGPALMSPAPEPPEGAEDEDIPERPHQTRAWVKHGDQHEIWASLEMTGEINDNGHRVVEFVPRSLVTFEGFSRKQGDRAVPGFTTVLPFPISKASFENFSHSGEADVGEPQPGHYERYYYRRGLSHSMAVLLAIGHSPETEENLDRIAESSGFGGLAATKDELLDVRAARRIAALTKQDRNLRLLQNRVPPTPGPTQGPKPNQKPPETA